MVVPRIAVILSSFERPFHLRRSLVSLALQEDVGGLFEVVVADDGSADESWHVVDQFARDVDFPVTFVTHRHEGFQLARCRNQGVAVSEAPYLLFSDADCVFPPEHLKRHLEHRRSGYAVAGDCYRLSQEASAEVTEAAVHSGDYLAWITPKERQRMAAKAWRARWYERLHFPRRPRLTGSNIGVWRSDYQAVNGFDENYIGWGLEDQDLQIRLSLSGVRVTSILHRTAAVHLWHPSAPSFARNNVGTPNLAYFQRRHVTARCENGVDKWPSHVRLARPGQAAFVFFGAADQQRSAA